MIVHNVLRFGFRALPAPVKTWLAPAHGLYISLNDVRRLNAAAQEIGAIISKSLPPANKETVFIDLGFNSGQATLAFMKALPKSVEFIGMEANTYFAQRCAQMVRQHWPQLMAVEMVAAGTSDGEVPFYPKGPRHSLIPFIGSSVHRDFSQKYTCESASTARTVDFSNWLRKKFNNAATKPTVIIKMDIEGSEYDVLEKMIADRTIEMVDHLIVEFHGRCFPSDQRPEIERRETAIKQDLQERGIHVYDWV
jgi:FkbM family methyltransferase